MNYLKITSGKVELCDSNGSHIRNIVNSNAINAELSSGGNIVVTYENGKVELLDDRGSHKSNIASDCINAKFNGEDIILTKKNNHMEMVNNRGSHIRNL